MTKAVTYGPNLHSDLSQLVLRSAEWKDVWGPDGIQLFRLLPEALLWGPAEAAADPTINDIYTQTKASGILPFLKQHGVPLVVELGVIKPGEPASLNGTFARERQLPVIIERVRECGGWLSGIALDEPLTFGRDLGTSYARTVAATAEMAQACQAAGLGCAIYEAYPFLPAADIAQFYRDVEAAFGGPLGGLIMDVDYLATVEVVREFLWFRWKDKVPITHAQITKDLDWLQAQGIPTGVVVMAIGATYDEAYVAEAEEWAHLVAAPERMLSVESWREFPSPTNRLLPTDLPHHMNVVGKALAWASERARPPMPGAPPIVITPPLPPLPPSAPQIDRWIGATAFRLAQLQMAGVDIRPFLEQFKACGFNILRVFGMKHNNTGWPLDPHGRPDYWGDLKRFFDTLASFSLRCEWNALIDTKFLMPTQSEQQDFVGKTINVYRPYGWPFSLGNEVTNGDWQTLDLGAFTKPVGVFSCHGSSETDKTPVQPFWDYATYGARRKEHDQDGRIATSYSPLAFEENYPKPVPFIATEGEKPERYGFDPKMARLMGQHARCGVQGLAGGFFHTSQGVNGVLFPSEVEACARAFCEGLGG